MKYLSPKFTGKVAEQWDFSVTTGLLITLIAIYLA